MNYWKPCEKHKKREREREKKKVDCHGSASP